MRIGYLALLFAGGLALASGQKPIANFKCSKGDCKTGFGVQEHDAGFKYEGEFSDGARTGLGVETMPGGVRFAGTFENNIPNGLGVMIFPDGRHFAGEWKNEFPHGCGLAVEVTQPDKRDGDLKMLLRHIGRWEEGEIVDPDAECHTTVNAAHHKARDAIAAAGGDEYKFQPEGPRQALSKQQALEQLEAMQTNILRMIGMVSHKAAEEDMQEVEQLSESLHALEITFVKMYYARKNIVGEEFKPLFSRDALETVIFETMLEIDESTVDDTTQMEEQLALMEEDLDNFPSEDEQNLQMLRMHMELTEKAIAQHKADGDETAAAEAQEHLDDMKKQEQAALETLNQAE